MKNAVLSSIEADATPASKLSLLEYLHQHEPHRLIWVDELNGHFGGRTAWLDAAERVLWRQPPTVRADGVRIYDLGTLLASTMQGNAGNGDDWSTAPFDALSRPVELDLFDIINAAEIEMERDVSASPELTDARLEAIRNADRRLLAEGLYRAEELGWGPHRRTTEEQDDLLGGPMKGQGHGHGSSGMA